METPPPLVRLHLELDPHLDFVRQQHDLPTVRSIQVSNGAATPLEELTLTLTLGLEVPVTATHHLARVDAEASFNLPGSEILLQVPTSLLREVTERERVDLVVELHDRSGTLLARELQPLALLPPSHWAGLGSRPELLAAFVLPNHPALAPVLRRAVAGLEAATGSGALDGYQARDPGRVRAQAAALYSALQAEDLAYVSPPASFEATGQKVLLPDRVLKERLATCLDVSLLYAALLERVGIRPLLLLVEGHALVGVWLEEEGFPEVLVDGDPAAVRKRERLGQLVAVEATAVTTRPSPDFEAAVTLGRGRIETPGETFVALDVRQARELLQVRPLPIHAAPVGAEAAGVVEVVGGADVRAPVPPPLPEERPAEAVETGRTRLDRWKARLLDLTFRNRLLNFRPGKGHLGLEVPAIATLEDELEEGHEFRIEAFPVAEANGHEGVPAAVRRAEQAQAAFERRSLLVAAPAETLRARLTEMFREARRSLEETGANTLYLALGTLVFLETPSSQQPRRAPLVLLPVTLRRDATGTRFRLARTDEDSRFNLTLLRKLELDFGIHIPGLDPLPEDASGLDLPRIFTRVREAILDRRGWEVVEDAVLGPLRFTKYLMWKDLEDRAAALLQNDLVRHLVETPRESFRRRPEVPDIQRLDAEHPAREVLCPMDADSSQLRAVLAASKGGTFVLEGPPGTGKSQTITNLIAQTLATGRTVLFVAEKRAALEVVDQRLERVGLEAHCLELHSNKVQKTQVLEQLRQALEVAEQKEPAAWEASAAALDQSRSELNAVVRALHRPRSIGLSVHHMLSQLVALRELPALGLREISEDPASPEAYEALVTRARELGEAQAAVHPPRLHPWAASGRRVEGPRATRELQEALEALEASRAALARALAPVARRLGLPEARASASQLRALEGLALELQEAPAVPRPLLDEGDWETCRDELRSWLDVARDRDLMEGVLAQHHEVEALVALDLAALEAAAAEAAQSFVLLRWWRTRSLRAALAGSLRAGAAPRLEELQRELASARRLVDLRGQLARIEPDAEGLLGRRWRAGRPPVQELAAVVEWVDRVRSLLAELGGSEVELRAALRQTVTTLVVEARDRLTGAGADGAALGEYVTAWRAHARVRGQLAERLGASEESLYGAWEAPASLDGIERDVERRLRALPELPAWSRFLAARQAALEAGLAELVGALEDGRAPPERAADLLARSLLRRVAEAEMEADERLRSFQGRSHEQAVAEFRRLDQEVVRLTREVVQARLAARVPRGGGGGGSSEVGILRRELGKKRRHMPVRKLLREIRNLLPRLCPCLLMSPLSVAQYLDAETEPFDLVVFDEASQIPVWDAVGAMARGKDVVVVGDSKQLPPTSFFEKVAGDDDEEVGEDDVEDLESVLDECVGADVARLTLDWHYRSRHEALIAFSNHHYYGGRLLVFPSPARDIAGLGVRWREVPDGFYDTGGSRTNRREAEEVVAEIMRRLRDPVLSKFSIGVVTFSAAQQTCVEDLLDAARAGDPEVAAFFGDEVDEPVFVKNLENVQGDERDVMLFSIGYGPDRQGRVYMRFGPLGRPGGDRRLNVAITRARRELIVFSTLRPEQIDLSRVRWDGVRHLKTFLDYAARGTRAIDEAVTLGAARDFDSPFEADVCQALTARGWNLVPQVGCSGYRIDLGVLDPEEPGRFLAGIECDGATYHRAATARDRDRLREEVLRGLGWEILRIWSSDWWQFRERELDRIQGELERLLRAPREPVTVEPPEAPAAGAAQAVVAAGAEAALEVASAKEAASPVPVEASAAPDPSPVAAPSRTVGRPYEAWEPVGRHPAESFLAASSTRVIQDAVTAMLAVEAPASRHRVALAVLGLFGKKRAGKKLVARFEKAVGSMPKDRRPVLRGEIMWRADQDPDSYPGYRVAGESPQSQRRAEELPPEEVANAAAEVLGEAVAMPEEDLRRECIRRLGFGRTGGKLEAAAAAGLDCLEARGGCVREGGKVRLG